MGANDAGREAGGPDDVESCDAEQPSRVQDASFLKSCGYDRYGGVDGVGDDKNVGLGGYSRYRSSEVADDRGVGLQQNQGEIEQKLLGTTHVEKIITGHLKGPS